MRRGTTMKKKPSMSANKTPSGKETTRSTGAGEALATAERLLLEHCKPSVWINYIQQSGRGRWPEAEVRILTHEDDTYIVDYARDIIKGRWTAGESRLQSYCNENRYAKEVIGGRWPELEQRLATREQWAQVRYATEILTGTALENELLRLRAVSESVRHCTDERKCRWPEFEPILFSDGKWPEVMAYLEAVAAASLPELEPILVKTRNVGELIEYAATLKKSRCAAIEDHLLRRLGDRQMYWKHPSTYIDKVLGACIRYAAEVIRGRWLELEALVEREWESVTSNQLCDYASRVIQGRLPDNLHNIMLMKGTMDSEDPGVKAYTREIGSQA